MFSLITLPYDGMALEPAISARTLEFHHGKHLKTYVDNLNKLIVGTDFEKMSIEEIVAGSEGAIFNNAGQILNHNLYFKQFAPASKAQGPQDGKLVRQIVAQWGSVEAFQTEFEAKGVSIFGSGWVWLSADVTEGKLEISQHSGAGNPVTVGRI